MFQNISNLQNVAKSFVPYIRSNIPTVGVEKIYNANQRDFNLEIHSRRTLAKSQMKTVLSNIYIDHKNF